MEGPLERDRAAAVWNQDQSQNPVNSTKAPHSRSEALLQSYLNFSKKFLCVTITHTVCPLEGGAGAEDM